jgi:hypothetical protein
MAELAKTVIPFGSTSAPMTLNTATASDYFTMSDYPDWRVNLVVVNADTHDATFTIKAGNGHRAAAGDVAVTVPASSSVVIPMSRVETSRVKNISGANKGKILTTAVAASGGTLSCEVAVIAEK